MKAFWRWLQEPAHFVSCLASLIPLLLVVNLIDTYTPRIPMIDQWSGSLRIAVAVQTHTLDLEDFIWVHGGHWHFFNDLTTTILTLTTNWNIRLETWLNPMLASLNCLLLAYLFWQQAPRLLYIALPIFAALVFALQQDGNWLNAYYATWHYVNFFFLAGLAALLTLPIRWRTLLLVILLASCGMLSFGTGMVIWGVLLIMIWAVGYRKPGYYLAWGIAAALMLTLYLIKLKESEAYAPPGWAEPKTGSLTDQMRFILAFLGSPFSLYNFNLAVGLGAAGILAGLLNLGIFWQNRHSLRELSVWLSLAGFALASATVVSLGRLNQMGLESALSNRYLASASLLWIALAALILLNSAYLYQRRSPLLYANLILAVLLGGWYCRSNLIYMQTRDMRLDHSTLAEYSEAELCIRNYPLEHGNLNRCPGTQSHALPEDLYALAAYQLNIFTDQPPVNVLPETYRAGSPIVIHTNSAWLNIYIQRIMLAAAPANILNIAPPPERHAPGSDQDLLQHNISEFEGDAVEAFLNDAEQVWYITIPEEAEASTRFMDFMEAQGYIATPYPIQQERYRLAKFSIWRFQQPPENTETIFSFGEENISLQAWSISAESATPCENISLQSWWQSAVVPQFNYSATLVLVAPDGRQIAQKDAAIGDTLMQLWFPGEFYFDERILTVPCDATPGTYSLVFGIYLNTGSGFEDLPAYDEQGAALGTRAPLTEITIIPPESQSD